MSGIDDVGHVRRHRELALAILHGAAGTYTKPDGVWVGLKLGIANPRVEIMLGANASGAASVSFNAPPSSCGRTVQAVDVASCSASYAIAL